MTPGESRLCLSFSSNKEQAGTRLSGPARLMASHNIRRYANSGECMIGSKNLKAARVALRDVVDIDGGQLSANNLRLAVQALVSVEEALAEEAASKAPEIRQLDSDLHKLLEKLLTTLESMRTPALPIDIALWDTSEIAAYLKRSHTTTRDTIIVQPDFPKPIRLPGRDRPNPLYKAREVIAWAEGHQSS